MGLPRANRLKHRRDFDLVYQKGIFRRTSHLILRAILESNKNGVDGKKWEKKTARVGISLGRKVSKKSSNSQPHKKTDQSSDKRTTPPSLSGLENSNSSITPSNKMRI